MKKVIGMFAMALILFSCSSIKVVSDSDKTIDFSKYKTLEYYGWAANSDSIMNRFDKERIEKAFGVEFEKRGFTLAEKGQGDMIVSLHIITKDKTQKTATTNNSGMYGGYGGYYGYGPGYGYGSGYSTTTVQEYDYTVGTLIVSVYDAKEKVLIWEAAGSGTIHENPKKREKGIPNSVTQIMYKYPVKPLSKK